MTTTARTTTTKQLAFQLEWRRLLLALLVWQGLLVISITPAAAATEIPIDWFVPGGGSLASVTAAAGDTLVFNFQTGSHNVYLHPSGTCNETNSEEVGSLGGGATNYTLQNSEIGSILVFACHVSDHCDQGQIMSVTVTAQTGDIPITWRVPGTSSLPPVTADVGERLVFNFQTGNHNVYLHPSGTCDQTNAQLIGTEGGGATTYSIASTDVGKSLVFACHISSHCESGQILTATVPSTGGPSAPAPTPAPTKAPSLTSSAAVSAFHSMTQQNIHYVSITTALIALVLTTIVVGIMG
ncbi:hypothetical protein ACA910_006483 [Epithemia clementina (nom. ined.)]